MTLGVNALSASHAELAIYKKKTAKNTDQEKHHPRNNLLVGGDCADARNYFFYYKEIALRVKTGCAALLFIMQESVLGDYLLVEGGA